MYEFNQYSIQNTNFPMMHPGMRESFYWIYLLKYLQIHYDKNHYHRKNGLYKIQWNVQL